MWISKQIIKDLVFPSKAIDFSLRPTVACGIKINGSMQSLPSYCYKHSPVSCHDLARNRQHTQISNFQRFSKSFNFLVLWHLDIHNVTVICALSFSNSKVED